MRRSKLEGRGGASGFSENARDPAGRQYPARAHKLSPYACPLGEDVQPYGGYLIDNDPKPCPIYRFVDPTGTAVEKVGDWIRNFQGVMVLIRPGQRPEDHPDWSRPVERWTERYRAIARGDAFEAKP